MARWLWIFWIYSFLGYGLEKLFAAVTHAPNQGRKCFLLLPLCPVYGLGMLAVLALPARGWWLVLWGGLAATAVEYAYHWACETFLGLLPGSRQSARPRLPALYRHLGCFDRSGGVVGAAVGGGHRGGYSLAGDLRLLAGLHCRRRLLRKVSAAGPRH